MKAAYLTYQSATLHRDGGIVVARQKRQVVAKVRVADLEQLVLMGNIVLTPAVLDLLLERGVDTVFVTTSGRYRGRITSGLSGSVNVRRAQWAMTTDDLRSQAVARAIVAGKIVNMRSFLLRVGRERERTEEQERSLFSMRASLERLEYTETLDQIRGCEGSATAAYFRCFDDFLTADGFRFDGRNRRPPLDPVNALLSFGYTLLFNAVVTAVNIVGLDPFVGTLHALETNRPSLACDLEEEYRVPIVDRLVVAALNKRVFQPDDFEDVGPGEPVVIRREAVRRLVAIFERRMESQVLYKPQNRRLTYRQILEQQARHYARVVLGKDVMYEPIKAK